MRKRMQPESTIPNVTLAFRFSWILPNIRGIPETSHCHPDAAIMMVFFRLQVRGMQRVLVLCNAGVENAKQLLVLWGRIQEIMRIRAQGLGVEG